MDNIISLYSNYGSNDYIGEDVSQVEHMIQSAMCAEADDSLDNLLLCHDKKEIIIACFLHDIGHLIGIKDKLQGNDYGILDHETIGKNTLESWGFKYPIPELVMNHVSAKRYLTYKYPEYHDGLSNASKETLKLQGGSMRQKEAEEFEANPLFELSLKMRTYDEGAKHIDVKLKPIEYYFDLINDYFDIKK